MYQQANGSGAKWFFWFAIVILAVVFALGLNIKDAKWLNGNIANATANQMNLTTDIDRQKAELEIQVLKQKTDIQIAQDKQLAEYETAQQQQQLETQVIAAAQFAKFRGNIFNAVSTGIMTLFFTISISIALWIASKSIASYKLAVATIQLPQRPAVQVRRAPSAAAQKAREMEKNNRKQLKSQKQPNHIEFLYTRPFWSEDEKAEDTNQNNSPWEN